MIMFLIMIVVVIMAMLMIFLFTFIINSTLYPGQIIAKIRIYNTPNTRFGVKLWSIEACSGALYINFKQCNVKEQIKLTYGRVRASKIKYNIY